MKKRYAQRGFTLLLASLVASILTSLGLAMYTIAQKQVILSSMGRDSQYAFYAADAGAECALYLDFYGVLTSSTSTEAFCNNISVGTLGGLTYDASGEIKQEFEFNQNGYCVKVEVTKYQSGADTTIINSRGYSTACTDENNPRRLERAVRMKY